MEIKPYSVNEYQVKMRLNPNKASGLFVGQRQTLQNQLRRHRTRLHCLLTECSKDEKYHQATITAEMGCSIDFGYCDGVPWPLANCI